MRATVAKSKQVKVRVDDALSDKIEQAAAASGRTVSDEIRRRVEASFQGDTVAVDPREPEFFRTLVKASQITELAFGNWRDDAGAFALFKRTVDLCLQKYQPEGEAMPRLKPEAAGFQASGLSTDIEQAAPLIALMAEMWIKERS